MSDKTVLERASAMAECLGDESWRDWTQEQAHEVEEVLDSLRRMVRDRDDGCCISCDPRLGAASAARQFARNLVEKVRRIQGHIEAGGANEELTAATVLCSEIIAEGEYGPYVSPKSGRVPEAFSAEQIAFLASLGVRVAPYGDTQSAFNDRAHKAEGRLRRLLHRVEAALRDDDSTREQP